MPRVDTDLGCPGGRLEDGYRRQAGGPLVGREVLSKRCLRLQPRDGPDGEKQTASGTQRLAVAVRSQRNSAPKDARASSLSSFSKSCNWVTSSFASFR